MALPYIFNFRSTVAGPAPGVTDAGGETYCISDTGLQAGVGESYTTNVRGTGIDFGWEQTNVDTRDRNATPGAKFAGIHFNGATTNSFKVVVPAGNVVVKIAAGDYSGAQPTKVQIFDDTTPRAVLCNATTAGADRFLDSHGNDTLSSAWNDSGTTVNISTGIFIMKIGDGVSAATGFIAHLEIAAAAVATPTKPMWPMSFF